ncbi:iron ABC transporter permease [Candidimonas humi]|uniref:ABC transporter permease n=1 Tax=Candidimonas humi TaxID=683355 RepID=A0ABV8NZY4_9BURK|nr:iron ABC transporter permease [Candidimonas humi]
MTETIAKSAPGGPYGSVTYRRFLGRGKGFWIQGAVFIVVVFLVVGAIFPIIYQSFIDRPLYEAGQHFTLQNYVRLFEDAGFWLVAFNSFAFAVMTTVIALVIAVISAIVIVRTRVPLRGLMDACLLLPTYISPLVLAFSWVYIYGPAGYATLFVQSMVGATPWNLYTLVGMAVTESVALVPIGYLYCSGAMHQLDSSLESAARTCGAGPWTVLRRVILPMIRPPVLYAALLIFSTSLETLSIPLLYGGPVNIELFASFIYTKGLLDPHPDIGLLGAASVLVLCVMAVLVVIQYFALKNGKRFISVRGKAARRSTLNLGAIRWLGFAFVALYLLLGPVLPMLGLVVRAFTQVLTPLIAPYKVLTLGNFLTIFSVEQYVDSIWYSVVIALVGGVATTLLATLVVLTTKRSRFVLAGPLEFVALAPQVVPGIILGLGFFWMFALVPGMRVLNGTLIGLMIAFGIRAFPMAFGAIAPIVMQIGTELDAAARTIGADWWCTFRRVLLRMLVPGLYASFVLLFVQMVKEFTPAIFLGSADNQVIGTTMLQMWLNGNTGPVAALSLMQILICVLFVVVAKKVLKVNANE